MSPKQNPLCGCRFKICGCRSNRVPDVDFTQTGVPYVYVVQTKSLMWMPLKRSFTDAALKAGLARVRVWVCVWGLTLSLPQSVKFPAWKMYGRTSKQYIFRSCNTSTFNAMCFDENSFPCQSKKKERKKKKKCLRVSNFAHLIVVFKWHHGSEGVNGWKDFNSMQWKFIGTHQTSSFLCHRRKIILADML